MPEFAAFLKKHGIQAEVVGGDWIAKLSEFNVLATSRLHRLSGKQAAAVSEFIRHGGGLITGDTGWGWLQLNPGKSLTRDHVGNKIISQAGLVWADGGLAHTNAVGFDATAIPSPNVLAGRALNTIEAQAAGRSQVGKAALAQAAWTVTHVARSLPADDEILLPRLRRLQQEHAAEAIPSPDQPLTIDQPLARLALTLEMQQITTAPVEQVKAYPSAKYFPGAVPADAPRVTESQSINTAVPGWHSTGLYAAPGEKIEVTIPDTAVGHDLGVRIGCHTDSIWHLSRWKRAPEISRSYRLATATTAAANAFGGLIYVEVPNKCQLGTISIEIKGGVKAPHFVLGRTTNEDWKNTFRDLPAPWAELESSKVILSVPSADIRTLDNPVQLMDFWVHVLDSCNELLSRPLERTRPERYVADVQISAGYMHSGYPIMTLLDAAQYGTQLDHLLHKGSWGHFHEMGHNHQSPSWTFSGTGEVTENLFSLYLSDHCCDLDGDPHPAVNAANRDRTYRNYFAHGPNFDKWCRDPFLALYMYMQLQEAFGWEAYKQVFAEYDRLSPAERPKSDGQKRDQWMVRFSRTVGRNLGPFFEAWGVPTSPAARESIRELPVWLPAAFPPQ